MGSSTSFSCLYTRALKGERSRAVSATEAIVDEFSDKWLKAVARKIDDKEALLIYYEVLPKIGTTLEPRIQ